MKIVIVGAGKVGSNLVNLLSNENHDIVVIDSLHRTVETIVNDYDVIGICGNGGAVAVMEDAGVENCDAFISVTGNDELNIMSCMVAKKLGAKRTVARVRNTDYSGQLLFMHNKLGIDLIINPEFEAAMELSRVIEFPAASKIETFAKGRIDLAEVTVAKDSPLDGVMLCDIPKKFETPLLICAVQRDGEVFIPKGDFVIEAGDRVHFTASRFALPNVFKSIGFAKKKIHSVFIVGGSRTSYYLAKYLLKSGKKVKLIELDRDRAAFLESNLDGASVICGDGTDPDLLKEEGLGNFDAAVALTNIDEENIILSMYAEGQGVKKTACKVNRDPLADMVSSMLSGCSVVRPKENTAAIILRYVRAVENAEDGNIQTLYKILGNKAEAVEFIATEDSSIIGKALRDIKFKPNNIVACVSHNKEVIIPDGNTVIRAGDSVIVITAGNTLSSLSEILE